MKTQSRQELVAKTESFIEKKIQEVKAENPNYKRTSFIDDIFSLDLNYGVDHSILTQNFGLFPHEIKNSAQCTQYAAYQYFFAEKVGFKPRFFLGYGLREHSSSLNATSNDSVVDHAFIDIDIGKKNRILLDRQLNLAGPVKYDLENKIIKLSQSWGRSSTHRTYDNLIELDREEVIDLLMKSRTTSGGIDSISSYLRTVKRYTAGMYNSCYVFKFHPKENTLRSFYNYETPFLANTAISQDLLFNPQNGSVKDSILKIGLYSTASYDDYKDYSELFSESQEVVNPFFELLKRVFETNFKSISQVKKKSYIKNLNYLENIGITSFNLNKIIDSYPDVLDSQIIDGIVKLNESLEIQFPSKIQNQRLNRALLLQTLYWANRKQNNGDYLFSLDQRDEPLLNKMANLKKLSYEALDAQLDFNLKKIAGINISKKTKGQVAVMYDKRDKEYTLWENIAFSRKLPSFRPEYDLATDSYQFGMQNVGNDNDTLTNQIKSRNLSILEEYKRQVFRKLIIPFQNDRILTNNPFITNLKKMITKHYKNLNKL